MPHSWLTRWYLCLEFAFGKTNKNVSQNSTLCRGQKRAAFPKSPQESGSKALGKGTGPSNLPKPLLASFCHASKNGRKKARKSLWFQGFRARYLNWLPTMAYDAEKDAYTCAQGKKLQAAAVKKRRSETGYVQEVTVYECADCKGCPVKRSASVKRRRTKNRWKSASSV